jgi:hypothetical protein
MTCTLARRSVREVTHGGGAAGYVQDDSGSFARRKPGGSTGPPCWANTRLARTIWVVAPMRLGGLIRRMG